MHLRDDLLNPFEAGRQMAAGIPGARFVALHEARRQTRRGVDRFAKYEMDEIDRPGAGARGLNRYQKVLVWLAAGLSWRTIADEIEERHEMQAYRVFRDALDEITRIANTHPKELILRRHIDLCQERNRAHKRYRSFT